MQVFPSPASVAALTAQWTGPRLADGRPCVADDVVRRLARITTEEAWAYLRRRDFRWQFEGRWFNTNPQRPFAGRAVTVRMTPARPDLQALAEREGARTGQTGGQNSWPIDNLQPGDALVVDMYGKVRDGTFVGDNLASTLQARGAAGAVIDGGIRDYQGIGRMPELTILCRGVDPTAIQDATLVGVNGPVRIGQATVLPGDVVLGTATGAIFVPAFLAQETVAYAEDVQSRDRFGQLRIAAGVYGAGDIDRTWAEPIEADYQQWLRAEKT